MKKVQTIFIFVLILNMASGQTNNTFQQKIEEWKDARFGMFIHWGPVTLKGTEIGWSRGNQVPVQEYDKLYKQFNPVNFSAEHWVLTAKEAGMKYIILTTRHHDGFCLWNTKYTDYNIMNTPFKRDVVKELSEACKKHKIAFGAYYSIADWYQPDYNNFNAYGGPGYKLHEGDIPNMDRFQQYIHNQLKELSENYGPLITFWFDGEWEKPWTSERGNTLFNHCRKIAPTTLVNNRVGKDRHGIDGTTSQSSVNPGDYDTPEQRLGEFNNTRPWETCMTIANQWAWKPNDPVKSTEQCLHTLLRSAGGDGNLLFNVGPMSDGQIEPLQVERLKEMGQWLQKYGHTIYKTSGGPFKPTDWGVSTRNGNTIYLHILNWFGGNPKLHLPDFGRKIKKCKLSMGGKIECSKSNQGGYILQFSSNDLKPIDTIIEIILDGNAMSIEPLEVASGSFAYLKKVSASSENNKEWNGIKNIVNGDWVGHAWKPAEDDKSPWVEIDLGKAVKVSKAIVYENGNSINGYEIQYKTEKGWQLLQKGKTIGDKAEISFPETEFRYLRMVLTVFIAKPSIYEIVLL